MFMDIMMAFVIAMVIESFSLGINLKPIMVGTLCISTIVVYFAHRYQIDFIGEIDFSIWILFVILFDDIIAIGINKLKKYLKE